MEVRIAIVEILSFAATLATIIGGIIAIIPYLISRRKKYEEFLKIGDFFNASQLIEEELYEGIKEKFTVEMTESGVDILGGDGQVLHFTAVEALMLLDILQNEEAELKRMAEEASPISIKIRI